jgi:hypothetical protein
MSIGVAAQDAGHFYPDSLFSPHPIPLSGGEREFIDSLVQCRQVEANRFTLPRGEGQGEHDIFNLLLNHRMATNVPGRGKAGAAALIA